MDNQNRDRPVDRSSNTQTQVIRTLISDEMLNAGLMALIQWEEGAGKAGGIKADLVCHIYAAMRVLDVSFPSLFHRVSK